MANTLLLISVSGTFKVPSTAIWGTNTHVRMRTKHLRLFLYPTVI